MIRTPLSASGLRKLDSLPAAEAVVEAWSDSGTSPRWHRRMVAEVRSQMPLLARALDRLVLESKHTDKQTNN